MSNETLSDVASGNWNTAAPSAGNSTTVKLEVGDVLVGVYVKSFSTKSKFSDTPGTGYEISNASVNGGDAAESVALFKKGNLGWLMSSVQEGDEVRIERLADDKLDNGFMSSTWLVQHRPAQA